jgi:hypothetical protein
MLIIPFEVPQKIVLIAMLNPKFIQGSSGYNASFVTQLLRGRQLNCRYTLFPLIMESKEIEPVRSVIRMSILNTPAIAVTTTNHYHSVRST